VGIDAGRRTTPQVHRQRGIPEMRCQVLRESPGLNSFEVKWGIVKRALKAIEQEGLNGLPRMIRDAVGAIAQQTINAFVHDFRHQCAMVIAAAAGASQVWSRGIGHPKKSGSDSLDPFPRCSQLNRTH
jgi:hypothetical protein